MRLALLFPTTGIDGALGRAWERGAELAVRDHMTPAPGYRLAIARLDEASLSRQQLEAALGKNQAIAVVGPLEPSTASSMTRVSGQLGIATISPAAPVSVASGTIGQGSKAIGSTAFFSLSPNVAVVARAAVEAAMGPAPDLGARTVFLTDDGSPSGRALAAAVRADISVRGGVVDGQSSVTADAIALQGLVRAIVAADPDVVFYAGGTVAGARLRRVLSETGAPLMPVLTAGLIADNPGWKAAVGVPAASAHTIGVLPLAQPQPRASDRQFVRRYRRAFPGVVLLPQSVVAYDLTMDEINAIQELIRTGKRVSRGSVRALIAGRRYHGISGIITSGNSGDMQASRFGLYACDGTGVWHYLGPAR